ncbi:MAG: DUF6531 domain-containing protein [Chloroflexi bacterium]|nr:DUF6531 domain-containing protein [Chloroflexota bacterium]
MLQALLPVLPVQAWASQLSVTEANIMATAPLAEVQGEASTPQEDVSLYLPVILHSYAPPITTVWLEPGVDATFTSPNGQQNFQITGANITQTIGLTYVETSAPLLPPGNLATAGTAFTLSAVDLAGTAVPTLPQAVTIIPGTEEAPAYAIITPTIEIELPYTDEMVAGLDLRVLFLYGFDHASQSWYRVPSATYQDEKLVRAYVQTLGTFVLMADLSARLLQSASANMRMALDPDDNLGHATWPSYGRVEEGPKNYELATALQQQFATNECHIDIIITRDASQQSTDVLRSIRAQTAINFDSEMMTTLAFQGLIGVPWGSTSDGGIQTYTRPNRPEDEALAARFRARVPEYTGRRTYPPYTENLYTEFYGLNMPYVRSETLFLDHNFDWPVIRDNFSLIRDGVYAALADRLAEMGLTCGPDNQPPALPAPPSAEVLQRLRDLGYQNMNTYGTKYDLIAARNTHQHGADPVNFSTGNFIFQDVLFTIPGRNDLDYHFKVFYNAHDLQPDILGFGWASPFNIRTQRYNDDSAAVILNDGRTLHYTWDGSNYNPPAGIIEPLTRTADGWQWETVDGTVLTFFETVTGLGILTTWQDRQANKLTFTHDLSGQNEWENGNDVPRPPLTRITNDAGQQINVTNDSAGRMTRLDLFDGRSVSFAYDGEGNLTHLTNTAGGTQQFGYDSRHRMTSLRDADNILYLQNFYDSRDRVVEQIDTDGTHLYLSYAATQQAQLDQTLRQSAATGQTTYTDNLGNTEIYYYDAQNRVVGYTNGRGHTEYYTYDDNYNLLTVTDRNEGTTSFGYDVQGNMNYLEEPVDGYSGQFYGEDISRWLYDERNLVISYTNALNNTWLYEYDSAGNLIEVIAPDETETTAAYNSWGQVTSITDAGGRTTTFTYNSNGDLIRTDYPDDTFSISTYDASGRETSFTDANGHTVYFDYDQRDNITRIRDPKGQDSLFVYDPNDLLTRATDRRSGESIYQYDGNLKLTAERDAELNWTFYGYDAMYNRVSRMDALGYVTLYDYDEAYNLISVTDPNGGVTRFEYDPNGNMTAVIDPLNRKTRFIYDSMNRVKFMIDAEGNRTEFCYDAEDQLIRMFDPRRAKTDYVYDEVGNLVEMIDPYGEVTQYEHDDVGNLVAVIDTLNQRTDMTYDLLDRLIKVENPVLPDGQRPTVAFEYDNVGNTVKLVDPLGRETLLTYDENDNVLTITDPAGGIISYAYDEEDNPVQITDQNGHVTSMTYNMVGLPTAVTDALSQTTFIAYDAVYNTISVLDPLGRVSSYVYDPMGQMTEMSDPLNNKIRYTYDLAGQVTKLLDGNGNPTHYTYDLVGRLITVTDAISGTTGYTYDGVGNLTSILDANQNLTTFQYNLYNQLRQEINPLGDKWTYSYDPLGRLVRRTDANFKATYYSYDSNGRLTDIQYGGLPHHTAPISFTYDVVGNELMMCDGLGCHTTTYDSLDRPVATTDWAGRTITRTYDGVSNLTSLAYPDGRVVSYTYNAVDWLAAVSIPGNLTSQYDYNAAGQVTSLTHPNNTRASFGYDGAGRLTSLDHRQIGAPQPQSAYAYALDGAGNRTQVIETRSAFDGSPATVVLTHTYQYDPLNRLIHAATIAPDSDTAYSFDANGNRLQKSGTVLAPDTATPELPVAPRPELVNYSYNAANQLLATDTTNFVYDPNGNRIQQTEIITAGVVETTDYVYDREDRLIGVSKSLSDTAGITVTMVATYTYDGYGRRAYKEVTYPATVSPTVTATQVITYLYNGLDIIGAELNQNGVITESYYYLAPSPLTGMWRPFAMERLNTSETFWYQLDGLDSVVSLTDAAGEVVESHLYDEYGKQFTDFSDLQLFVYSSQDYDPETGFYHFYSRYYDAIYGIWLVQDRYRGQAYHPSSLHRYKFVNNNPIVFIDFYGFAPWDNAIIGVQVHKIVQSEYKRQFPNASTETRLCSSFQPRCLSRTDIRNEETHEVYEIKPNSKWGNMTGPIQLTNYVRLLNDIEAENGNGRYWKAGTKWNPNMAPFYVYYPGGKARVTVKSSSNGIIYYDAEKFPNPSPKKTINLKPVLNIAVGIVAVVAIAAIVYLASPVLALGVVAALIVSPLLLMNTPNNNDQTNLTMLN